MADTLILSTLGNPPGLERVFFLPPHGDLVSGIPTHSSCFLDVHCKYY